MELSVEQSICIDLTCTLRLHRQNVIGIGFFDAVSTVLIVGFIGVGLTAFGKETKWNQNSNKQLHDDKWLNNLL